VLSPAPAEARRTQAEIQAWLIAEIARRAAVPPESVDITASFAAYRLDSLEGVNMAGALEDFLGVELEPTLVWDFPTVEKLSRYLCQLPQESPGREV
jgi:acyl carrier protein